jgi:hypothetical protein
MNIDQEIRNILARSCPVNDNRSVAAPKRELSRELAHDISIVGNHNIVVSSDLLLMGLFMFLNMCGIIYLLH